MAAEPADFGAKEPGPKLGDAQIVLAEPLGGSTKLTNAAADGNVVLVKRGNIPFVEKAMNAQNAGATAVIIYNNEDGPPQGMSDNGDYETAAAITIPVVGITQADGTQLATAIKAGRTTISLQGTLLFSSSCTVLYPSMCLLLWYCTRQNVCTFVHATCLSL